MGWSNLFSWIMRWIATTFADFAAAWSAASNSKPGTQVVYEGYLRLHLLPRLGAVEMGKLAPQTIEAFKVACHEHGLSARTIGHILALLRQMLNRAVDWGYLRVNPAQRVKAPVVEKQEMQLWTEEEAHRFLEHVPRPWYAFFCMALATGMRVGELIAAKWEHLAGHTYFVAQTRNSKTQRFGPPKTKASRASVDVAEAQARVAELQLRSAAWADLDLIFPGQGGKPMSTARP